MAQLLDTYGRPVRTAELTTEAINPRVMALRQVWAGSVASGLTPARLGSLLRGAAEGDAYDYLTLAEEMEERDLHYGSVLRTRKLAVGGLAVHVEAASDGKADVDLADELRGLVEEPSFGFLAADLLDALGKGWSACEIQWERSAKQWWPTAYDWRDPRLFKWDRENLAELRIDDQTPDGQPLPPYKFAVHVPRLKTGIPLRGGLARMVAWMHLIKSYDVKDWVAFAEVFGMPIRLGKYGPGASEDDKSALLRAVANIGSDAAGIIPSSMMIEFEEAGTGRGVEVFQHLADWCDKQVSKGVLGQTATTEGTPGKLGGEDAQQEVRQDLLKADAAQLAHTLNRDVVRPYVDLNHGPRERGQYPRLVLHVPEPEDIKGLTDALAKLVPLGLRVEASAIRDKLGLEDPQDGAEILAPADPVSPAPDPALQHRQGCPVHGTPGLALNATAAEDAELAALEALALEGWEEQAEPLLAPIRTLVEKAQSWEDVEAGLVAALAETDGSALARALAERMFMARAGGDLLPG